MTANIVVGVDGSNSSRVALADAAHLAEQTGSRLSVVFVHDALHDEARRGSPEGPSPVWRRLTRRSPSTSARGRPLQERPRRTCLAVFGASQAVTRLNGRPRQLRA